MKIAFTLLTICSLLASVYAFTLLHDVALGLVMLILSAVYATIARAYYKSESDYKDCKRLEQHEDRFR